MTGRLFRVQRQMQLKLSVDGLQLLIRAFPLNPPVAIPDAGAGCAHAGDSGAGAIRSFRVIKLPPIQVAQSKVREINILHVPSCSLRWIAADGLAEKMSVRIRSDGHLWISGSPCSTTTPFESRDDRNGLSEIRIDSRAPRCGIAPQAGSGTRALLPARPAYSSWTASSGLSRTATCAGYKPASTVAA